MITQTIRSLCWIISIELSLSTHHQKSFLRALPLSQAESHFQVVRSINKHKRKCPLQVSIYLWPSIKITSVQYKCSGIKMKMLTMVDINNLFDAWGYGNKLYMLCSGLYFNKWNTIYIAFCGYLMICRFNSLLYTMQAQLQSCTMGKKASF